jgi:glycosyltransferase involved in cell wall biosynthesis
VGGLPEIVEQRRTGLLVENQPAAIAATIGELKADPELARGLGRAARRRVMEEFTVGRMVRRTMEIYREIYRQVLP